MSLTPEELAVFDDDGDDSWGFDEPVPGPAVTPALAAAPAAAPKRGIHIIDQSTKSDAQVKAERAAAAILPPDAPASSVDTPAPVKRGRKAKDAKPGDVVTVPALGVVTVQADGTAKDAAGKTYPLHPTTEAEPVGIEHKTRVHPDIGYTVQSSRVELGPESMALLRAILAALS